MRQKRRKYIPDATPRQAVARVGALGGDQEAGKDEEHVDAGEAAAERREVEVAEQHEDDGDPSQAIELGAALGRRGGSGVEGRQRRSASPRTPFARATSRVWPLGAKWVAARVEALGWRRGPPAEARALYTLL